MSKRLKVCVVGDSGLLGQAVVGEALRRGAQVLGVSSAPFQGNRFWPEAHKNRYHHLCADLLKTKDLFFSKAERFRPDLLINCVALVDLTRCEKSPQLAKRLNSGVAEYLAGFCKQHRVFFTHISTDQVFDGRKRSAYSEKDKPSPPHVYGKTKWLGERGVLRTYKDALVIRTNIIGFRDRANQPAFVDWLCESLQNHRPIILAQDFITSSIHAGRLAELLFLSFHKHLKGIYHMASSDSISKYEFGRKLANKLKIGFDQVKKGVLEDLGLTPYRPARVVLDVAKAEKALGISLPKVSETVRETARDCHLRLRGMAR